MHFDPPLAGPGYPRLLNPWRKPYRTTDGYLCAMPYTDLHWRRFFAEAGAPEIAADPRFTSIAERTKNIEALYELAGNFIAGRSTGQWLAAFSRLEIPASRMNRLEDLRNDEHLRGTGFFKTIDDPAMGRLQFPGVPVRLDRKQLAVGMPPRLGQHTAEVLASIGMASQAAAAPLPDATRSPSAL